MTDANGVRGGWVVVALCGLAAATAAHGEDAKPGLVRQAFDDVKDGALPKGWQAGATNPKGEPATWAVAADDKAPSPPNVLSVTKDKTGSLKVYNLAWTKEAAFKDGTVSVRVRANAGEIDQGGGVVWRAADANNYYIARYNPLEKNFRLYVVKDGVRKQLADAKDIDIPAGTWFAIKAVQKGDRIECCLDGKKLLEATDATLPEAGGVGVWTKADAATSFDDLEVVPD